MSWVIVFGLGTSRVDVWSLGTRVEHLHLEKALCFLISVMTKGGRVDTHPRMMGDVNGDDMADSVLFWRV